MVAIWWLSIRPSNDRNWSPDQVALPEAVFSGSLVTVRNVRNSVYRSTTDYDVRWEERTYDLSRIRQAWYVVEPFSEWEGSAHTFLTFGFGSGSYVGVSIEIRKETGEKFSALKGVFKQYELMYVVGDERDLIQVRTNYRKDQVYLYPLRFTPEQTRTAFVSLLTRANALREEPEFYHSVWNSCATNAAAHLNEALPGALPGWDIALAAPGYSDKLFLERGLIDTDLPWEKLRDAFRINNRAEAATNDPHFSDRIRGI